MGKIPAEMEHELLRQAPLFQGIPAGAMEAVIAAGRTQRISADSFLFYQDDPVERVYIVTRGRIKLAQLTPDGQQVIMRVATPGVLIAAISLVDGTVYPVTAQAAEDSQVLYWTQGELLEIIERYPLMALNAMRILAGHVREFQDRYRELATERVERRVARAILRLARQVGRKTDEGVLLDLPLTRQDLAEMTGTTLYTVSRILSQWENQGLVLAGRERVVIRFPHGLVRVAEDLPSPEDQDKPV